MFDVQRSNKNVILSTQQTQATQRTPGPPKGSRRVMPDRLKPLS